MTDADLDHVVYYDDGGVRVSAASVRFPSETIPLGAISGVTIERRRLTILFLSLYILLASAFFLGKRLIGLDGTLLFRPLALATLGAIVASLFVRVRYVSLRLHDGRQVEGPSGAGRSGRILAAVRTALDELNEHPPNRPLQPTS